VQSTLRIVLLVVVGVGLIGAGLYAALRPDKAIDLSYRWRRWWIRSMSFGKVEAAAPPYSDQTARRLMLAVGIVLIVVGIGLVVSSVVSLSN
jgi:uncharacterized membrane protein